MLSVAPFAITGIILIIGFLGNYLFKKLYIPDILILIFLGFLLGPIFGIIKYEALTQIVPIFISLALIVILFDGGLNLKLSKVIQNGSRSVFLATFGFITSILITTVFMRVFFSWDLLSSALLGSIIGGTSSSIVIPLITRIEASDVVKTILSLEAVFTDTLVIIVSIALLQLSVQVDSRSVYLTAAKGISSAFSIGIVLGFIAGVFWLGIIKKIRGETYDDILTLAFVFLTYAVVEILGGNGAISALVFGLVLGNGISISKMLKRKEHVEAGGIMLKFNAEISFFIRTFFFVYLGMIVMISDVASTLLIIFYATFLAILLLLGRFFVVWVFSHGSSVLIKQNKQLITTMFPRGLSAAVLSQMVIESNIPNASFLSEFVIFIILITTIFSAVGVSAISREQKISTTKKTA